MTPAELTWTIGSAMGAASFVGLGWFWVWALGKAAGKPTPPPESDLVHNAWQEGYRYASSAHETTFDDGYAAGRGDARIAALRKAPE